MRHHIGAGYPHTHGMGMGGGAFDLENGATETKGRFKDKPVGDYAQIGHHVVPLTWSRLTKWLICLCILMVCLDFFIEAIDHVVSEHGTHDENGEYQSLHSKHAELLQKGVQADLQKMRTSFRQGRQPTAAGEKPEPALEKPRTLQYEEGMVLDEFCEDEDVSGIPISEDEMMNQVSSGKGHWVHVTTPSTEGETANTDDTCARICSWKDKVDSVVPFGLCTFDPEKDPHISRSIQEAGLWNGMKKDLTQFALPMKDYTRTVYIDIGANLGFYSVMAAKRGYDVIIVEPSKEQTSQILCSLYKNNIRVADSPSGMNRAPKIREADREPTAWVFQNAAYDRSSEMPFSYEAGNPGASHLDPARVQDSGDDTHRVDAVILDELVYNPDFGLDPQDVHMLKISTEMSDVRVLRGARHLLAQGKIPFVHLVFNRDHIRTASCDPRSVLFTLRKFGYKLYESNVYYLKDEDIESYLEKATGSMELLFVGPDTWF